MNLPPYDIFPEIRSETVILREILAENIKNLVEISFYDSLSASSVDEAMEMSAKINQDYQKGESIHWGIAGNSTNEVIGTVGYYRGFENGNGELGCVLKPEFRGQGFMTAAMELAIEFGIHIIGLTTIKAITSKQNTPAIKLLERLNFSKTADLAENESEYQFVGEIL